MLIIGKGKKCFAIETDKHLAVIRLDKSYVTAKAIRNHKMTQNIVKTADLISDLRQNGLDDLVNEINDSDFAEAMNILYDFNSPAVPPEIAVDNIPVQVIFMKDKDSFISPNIIVSAETSDKGRKTKVISPKSIQGMFKLEGSIINDDYQPATVPDNYEISNDFINIAKIVKETTGTHKPVRNVILYGPAGTGKSVGARIIAAALGLPYVNFLCTASTTDLEMCGEILPAVAGAVDEDYTKDFVFKKSVIVQALENGWVVEIAEANVAASSSVLTCLNSFCDDNQQLTLKTGEVIKRHPNAVIIMTMNPGYEGVLPINESVWSRANIKKSFTVDDYNAVCKRVLKAAGLDGDAEAKKALDIAITIQNNIKNYMKKNGYKDLTDPRAIDNFAAVFKATRNIRDTLEYTIVNGATSDISILKEIITSCVLPVYNY